MVHLRKLHSIPIKVVCIVFIFIPIILACYYNREKLVAIFHTYKLIPLSERYTELYIGNHDSLPLILEPEQVATASFTIHNKEGQTYSYSYLVTGETGAEKQIVASGSARIQNNEWISIPFTVQVATTEPKTKYTIALPEKQQSVHFWVNNL